MGHFEKHYLGVQGTDPFSRPFSACVHLGCGARFESEKSSLQGAQKFWALHDENMERFRGVMENFTATQEYAAGAPAPPPSAEESA